MEKILRAVWEQDKTLAGTGRENVIPSSLTAFKTLERDYTHNYCTELQLHILQVSLRKGETFS
jgi:hypothetical protein